MAPASSNAMRLLGTLRCEQRLGRESDRIWKATFFIISPQLRQVEFRTETGIYSEISPNSLEFEGFPDPIRTLSRSPLAANTLRKTPAGDEPNKT
jgi:hypothetical protein